MFLFIFSYFLFILSLQFYELIRQNKIAMFNLEQRSVTIFAPTNEAFQKFSGGRQHVHVQYHMCKYKAHLHK